MTRETVLGACALALLVSGCQTMMPADPVKEATAIKRQDEAWNAAIAAKDEAKAASFYSEDAVFLPPNDEAKSGDAIRKDWAGLMALPNVHLTFAPTRVKVDQDGEMATDVGTYEFSFDGPKGRVSDHGKYAQTWEKRNGVWKCTVDMYNSSLPMPEPPAPPACPAAPACPVAAPAASAKKPAKKK